MRISDWSSDVCSSDLATQAAEHVAAEIGMVPDAREHTGVEHLEQQCRYAADHHCVEITMNAPGGRIRTAQPRVPCGKVQRSEERRGGKEWVSTCSIRWSPDQ